MYLIVEFPIASLSQVQCTQWEIFSRENTFSYRYLGPDIDFANITTIRAVHTVEASFLEVTSPASPWTNMIQLFL